MRIIRQFYKKTETIAHNDLSQMISYAADEANLGGYGVPP